MTQDTTKVPTSTGTKQRTPETIHKELKSNNIFEYSSDGYPKRRVYAAVTNRDNCLFVISKIHPEHLSVYEVIGKDTNILAIYPVCLARNKGQKEKTGDNRTPESYPGKPFSISQIQDASKWHHDFGDGRGSIPAYGHWFMRLVTPGFRGIGIHGSTNNRESIIKGRGSEGCIRLLDEDIIHLKENYAKVGTPVIILPEDFGPLSFEILALNKANLSGEIPHHTVSVDKLVSTHSETQNDARSKPEDNRDNDNKNKKGVKSNNTSKTTPAKQKNYVMVKGTRQQLRTGPTNNNPFYQDANKVSICPTDGECLELLEEVNERYYKVIFDGKELYINKISCIKL